MLWFGGVNLILALHVIPWAVNEHNPIVQLDYDRAWTVWPGTVHLTGFAIRGRDREHLEFSFAVDEAYAVVDLPALLHQTFHTTHVDVIGLDTRFRLEFDPTERVQAHQDALLLPPIAGYADPPMKVLGPPTADVDDAHYADWTVDLEDIHVQHLKQLWVHELRFTLDANLVGQFFLKPERSFELTMSSMVFTHGQLSLGSDLALDTVAGSIAGQVDAFDPRTLTGYDFFKYISVRVMATGVVPGLHILHHHLPGFGISGGGGPLDLAVVLEHGLIAEGTQVTLHGAPLTLESDRLALHGPLSIDAKVVAGTTRPRGTLNVEIAPVKLTLRKDVLASVTGPAVHLRATSSHLDLNAPMNEWEVTLDADHLVAPLAPWLSMVPKAVTIDSGEVGLETHLSFSAPSERGKGHVHATSNEVLGHVAGRKVGASVEATVAIDRFDLRTKTLELAGSELAFHALRAPSLDHDVGGWWLKAELDRGSLDLSDSPVIEATAQAHARDARPILDFIAELGSIPHVLSQALTLPNLEARAQAHLQDGKLTISPIRVASGDTNVIATACIGDAVDATLVVHSGPLALGLDIVHNGVHVNLFHGEEDLQRALDLAARSESTTVRDNQ